MLILSEIVEKRSVKIPPCKIEKDLIREIGELLESQEPCENRLRYSLDTRSKDMKSRRVKDFVEAEWGLDINGIVIKAEYTISDIVDGKQEEIPEVEVNINFRYRSGYFSVSGKDATWVNGIANQVEQIFDKYKLKYYQVKSNWLIKLPLIIATSLPLVYPIHLVSIRFLYFETETSLFFLLFLVSCLVAYGINKLIDWLFPYFEYGETPQAWARKWIWILLYGSGLIPSFILKLLGL